jgi:signal transduction histidine kinase/ActR/RegA family two-component response regulator
VSTPGRRGLRVPSPVLVVAAAGLLACTILMGVLVVGQTQALERNVATTERIVNANVRTLGQVQRELLRMDLALQRDTADPVKLDLQRAFVAQRMREATNSYTARTLGTGPLLEQAQGYSDQWFQEVEPLIARVVADPAGSGAARAEATARIESLERGFFGLTTAGETNRKDQAGAANRTASELLDSTRRLLGGLVVTLGLFAAVSALALRSVHRSNRRRQAAQRELVEVNATLRQVSEVATRNAQAKADFLASMSHEIRTPLNAVIGLNELLLQTDLDDRQREFVQTSRDSGNLLLELVNDILSFSALESGEVALDREPFDLRALVVGTVRMFHEVAEAKGLSVRHLIDPALATRRMGDEVRIRQVLVNLIGNAVKFTDAGGVEVRVHAVPDATDPDAVRITVQDTGIGIPADHLEHLFDPFSQGDASAARRHGGTGLGLAICQRIVSMTGGRISIDSTPGVGTVVEVDLVLAEAAPPSVPVVAPADRSDGRPGSAVRSLRVLVAEDDPVNQLVARHLLEALGVSPDIVAGGEDAHEAVRGTAYDVVFMDIHMPGVDGIEAARRIRGDRTLGHRPRLVAMTASALAGDREHFLASGLDDYVSKPVRLEDLAEALARAVPADPPEPSPLVASRQV